MIRAGISGTNWTGKTTSIRALCDAHANRRIEVISLGELVRQCPHPTEQAQVPDASRWMLEQVAARLNAASDADIQVFDRTPLDILAYTQYAYRRLAEPSDESLIVGLHDLWARFDHVFYLAPEDEWPIGVSPEPMDIGFALLMDWYIRRVIRTAQRGVVRLPWQMDQRKALIEQRLFG